MKLYHRTLNAEAIIQNGFRDTDALIGGMILRGAWLSDTLWIATKEQKASNFWRSP